jgi:hypothetical protein
MLQFVSAFGSYAVYYDTDIGNYKIKNSREIIANPSTYEDAQVRLGTLTGKADKKYARRCTGCITDNCNDCERYN